MDSQSNEQKKLVIIVVAVSAFLFLAFFVTYGFSVKRNEISLRNQIDAKKDEVMAAHSKMWDVLNDKLGLAKYATQKDKEILTTVALSRGGGALIKTVQEKYPSLPSNSKVIRSLTQSIEAERAQFFTLQKEWRDLGREHDNLIDDPVFGNGSMLGFLKGKDKIQIKLIAREESHQAIGSGVESQSLDFGK